MSIGDFPWEFWGAIGVIAYLLVGTAFRVDGLERRIKKLEKHDRP